MDPTDMLMNEHQLIKQVLRCLERLLAETEKERRLEETPARQALGFLREYAEGVHLSKEEELLFPAIRRMGRTAENALIGDLHDDHIAGRAALTAMAETLPAAAEGEPRAVETFVRHGRDYAAMLRRHIRREDDYLFPMAGLSLGFEEQRDLLERFKDLDRDLPAGRFECLADELADRYGVSKVRFTFGSGS
jgi:hemerythrin-like domain-containing protein